MSTVIKRNQDWWYYLLTGGIIGGFAAYYRSAEYDSRRFQIYYYAKAQPWYMDVILIGSVAVALLILLLIFKILYDRRKKYTPFQLSPEENFAVAAAKLQAEREELERERRLLASQREKEERKPGAHLAVAPDEGRKKRKKKMR